MVNLTLPATAWQPKHPQQNQTLPGSAHRHTAPSAATGGQPWRLDRAQPLRRVMRVAATFCDSHAEADALRHALRRQLGLDSGQLSVLGPADSEPVRFAHVRERWDRLRPRRFGRALLTALWVGIGAALGGVVALGWTVTGTAPVPLADIAALCIAATLGGALVGRLLNGMAEPGQSRRRQFDTRLQRKLAAGGHAVVAHGAPDAIAQELFEILQASGHGWCAEAPWRIHRAPASSC